MREERSRLRTQVYILEKERASHEAQQQTTTAQLRILQTTVSDTIIRSNIRWCLVP